MDFRRFWLALAVVSLTVASVAPSGAGVPTRRGASPFGIQKPVRVTSYDSDRRIDVNNLNMWVTNYGSFGWDILTGNAGLVYPKGTTKTAVFASGLWLGAEVGTEVRIALAEYSFEYGPGKMVGGSFDNPSRPDYITYKVARFSGNPSDTAHVERAASYPDDQLVHHSWSEYMFGAVPYGAPWKLYRLLDTSTPAPDDSVDVPGPDVLGDQMLWCVYNDADGTLHTNNAGQTSPLGVEVQQTTFGFNRQGPLGNTVFVKLKIINKGTDQLDNMYAALWSDPDLGGFTDDLVGCDTTLSLGFCYNATNNDQQYGSAPPAVGYDFFVGPTDVNGDTLGLTSFNKYINGTDPGSFDETYNYMRGFLPDGSDLIDPLTGQVTKFFHPGDPVTDSGWLDSNPADRRFLMNSGPFAMAPGDTQEVVGAVIVAQGSDRLNSVTLLRQYDQVVQGVFELGFAIPGPPPAPSIRVTPLDGAADLTWGKEPVGTVDSTNAALLNQEFHFEGYNLYQGASAAGPWKKIATFDVENDVMTTYAEVLDPAAGGSQRLVTQKGTDSGLEFHVQLKSDAIRGGRLVNARPYWFAVTAYSYDVRNITPVYVGPSKVGDLVETLESSIVSTQVIPASSAATLVDKADHVAGASEGSVELTYLNLSAVNGHRYRVSFRDTTDAGTPLTAWDLYDLTTGGLAVADAQTAFGDATVAGQTVYGMTNLSGDLNYPVVGGIMVRVQGPEFGIRRVSQVLADGSLWDVEGNDSPDTSGTWYEVPFTDPDHSGTILERHLGSVWVGSGRDYEVRFFPDTTEYCWDFFGAPSGNAGVNPFKVAVGVWDLTLNRRITFEIVDGGEPNMYGWGDGLYFQDIPYDDVAWTTPGTENIDYDPTDSKYSFRRFFFYDLGGATMGWPPAGTRVRITVVPVNTPADTFVFVSKPPGAAANPLTGNDLGRIRAVPNPYYSRSAYEMSQFNRIVKFTNLPATKVTIRIFNLAGELVRTLTRTDPSQAIMQWDLLTDRQLPVGSGVYVYHVDAGAAGTTFGRVVVFMEKERLNNF